MYVGEEGYIRTDLADELHEKYGFRTDYEIITEKKMKKILKVSCLVFVVVTKIIL